MPLATDDVHFDANSPNCTVNTSGRVALTLDFTGYTGTITMTQAITVSGSVTLVSAMTISGSGALAVNATATITSNTKSWPNAMTIGSSGTTTVTLADNWTVLGLLTLGSSAGTVTINSNGITASAGLTHGGSSSVVGGTTTLLLNGTGTITGPSSTGHFKLATTINTAGTLTMASGTVFQFDNATLTYTAGTVVTTNSTLSVLAGPTTLDTGAIIWDKVSIGGAFTVTLSSNLNLTGLFTFANVTSTVTVNGFTISAGGGVRFTHGVGIEAGTTILKLSGTGTVDAPSVTTGHPTMPVTIDAGNGTVTFTTPVLFDLGTFKYVSGTVITNATWTSGGGQKGFPLVQ